MAVSAVLVAAFIAGRQIGGAIGKSKTIKKRADVEARNMELRAQVEETNAAIQNRDRIRRLRGILGQQRALAAGGMRTVTTSLTDNLLTESSIDAARTDLASDIRADTLRIAADNTRSFAKDAAKKILVSGIIQGGSTFAAGLFGAAGGAAGVGAAAAGGAGGGASTGMLLSQQVGSNEQNVQAQYGSSGQL